MAKSATFRDLSQERGVIMYAPGSFYPSTTEEPNFTDERYAHFMSAVEGRLADSNVKIAHREGYYPGPPNTGGGVGHVVELIRIAGDYAWLPSLAITIWAALWPDEARTIGSRIKSGMRAAKTFNAWESEMEARQLPIRPHDFPVFLQPTIEDLCLLNVFGSLGEAEELRNIVSTNGVPNGGSTASHPSGAEQYEVIVDTNQRRFRFSLTGNGRGIREITLLNEDGLVRSHIEIGRSPDMDLDKTGCS